MFAFGKSRLLSDSLHKVSAIIDRMARGDIQTTIDVPDSPENRELVDGLRNLQDKLARSEAEMARLKSRQDEMQRLIDALHVTSTSVMVADAKYNITYINRTALNLFRSIESDLRQDLPNFNANSLLGSHIDVFHKNPAHQRQLLDRLTTTHRSALKIGGRTLEIIANPITDESGKRLGVVVEWADRTVEAQQKEREQQLMQESMRLRNALDNTSTNVMVADENNIIVYMNTTAQEMFKAAESELRRSLPHFRADQLIGVSMDAFHKDPSHQRRLLERLNGTHRSQVQVGNNHFQIIANPIVNSEGKRFGTVVEWANKTGEVHAQNDIQRLVESIKGGELHSRITLEGKDGVRSDNYECTETTCVVCRIAWNRLAKHQIGLIV